MNGKITKEKAMENILGKTAECLNLIRKNGDSYEGYWKEGLQNGNGTFYQNEIGRTFIGNYKKGKNHGEILEIYPDGRRKRAEYIDGDRIREL